MSTIRPSFTGPDPSNTIPAGGGRPDALQGVSAVPTGGGTVSNWVNLAAFAIPGCTVTNPVCTPATSPGRFGDVAIDTLPGPPMRNIDLAVMKNFHTTERFMWQVEVQFADLFNHPDFNAPSGNISTPSNGGALITSTLANDLQGSGAARSIYAMIKVTF